MDNLSKIKKGQKAKVTGFLNESIMCNMSRLGILKGDVITCVAKSGPVIIAKEQLKLAVGRNLATEIYVEKMS